MSKAKENVFVAIVATLVVAGGVKVRLEDERYSYSAYQKVTEAEALARDGVECRVVGQELHVFSDGKKNSVVMPSVPECVEVHDDGVFVQLRDSSFLLSFQDVLGENTRFGSVAGAWPFTQSIPVFESVK